MALSEHFGLIPHEHSGAHMPHHHTSYPVLILLTLLMGLVMMTVSFRASANPLSGQIQLSGLVPGPPPPTAPTIETPSQNQRFSSIPIVVQGTCISTYTVVVERGGTPVGSVTCGGDSRYQLSVDLAAGQNSLTVRQYDLLNQSSPISPAVTVFYDVPAQPITPVKKKPATKPTAPIVLPQPFVSTSYVNNPAFPDTNIELPIEISGGTQPFAVNIDWGDGNSDLISRETTGAFTLTHVFKKAGNYTVKITVTDKNGLKAFTQTTVIINGKVAAVTGITYPGGNLLIAWPIYAVMVALVFGFWLGEHHDRSRWRHAAPAQ